MHIKRAFTLIELLVVIAIIAILAAILFPVFAQAKAAAKKTDAISNTKQVTLAAKMYNNDNDDDILPRYDACGVAGLPNSPSGRTRIWPALVQPYAKNEGVFLDRAATKSKYGEIWDDNGGTGSPEPGKWGRGWDSIGANSSIMGWYYFDSGMGACPARFPRNTETMLSNPAKTVYFLSSNAGETALGWRGYLADNAPTINTQPVFAGEIGMASRHNDGNILGFFDGHVKYYKTSAIVGQKGAAQPTCVNYNFVVPTWWFDLNGAKLKFNIQDTCIEY